MSGRLPVHPRREEGFTLLELMTALAVIAVLAAMAVPTMRSVIENGRIRTASTSIQNGLALARAEAVRLNAMVEFSFTADGWEVRRVNGGGVLHQAAGMEISSSGLSITSVPGGGEVSPADRATFTAFGRLSTVNPSNDTFSMTRIDIEAANPSGSSNYRPLVIQLVSGGVARLCDPGADADQPRACL